jgi:putative ABC transport system substrate-binding protein
MTIHIGRRKLIAALGGAAVAWPLVARTQPPALPVIGVLSSQSPAAVAGPLVAFHRGLNEFSYDEGQTIAIEYRWAGGQYDRLPELAIDLVRRKVAVLVALGGDPPALAANAATPTIPIVFIVGSDPVRFGLVESLNRPGGNATGINLLLTEIESKRIGLLHELVPSAAKLAMLINPKTPNAEAQKIDVQAVTGTLGLPIEILDASGDADIELAFTRLTQSKIGALLVEADPFFTARRNLIISLATQHAVPTIYALREFSDSGGLMSYGTNLADAYQKAGNYVGRILKGEKPADLPVVQLTKFELVINLRTAKALGLTVPQTLLVTADQVIE